MPIAADQQSWARIAVTGAIVRSNRQRQPLQPRIRPPDAQVHTPLALPQRSVVNPTPVDSPDAPAAWQPVPEVWQCNGWSLMTADASPARVTLGILNTRGAKLTPPPSGAGAASKQAARVARAAPRQGRQLPGRREPANKKRALACCGRPAYKGWQAARGAAGLRNGMWARGRPRSEREGGRNGTRAWRGRRGACVTDPATNGTYGLRDCGRIR